MKSDIVRVKTIAEKKIYIVDNHHEVLLPWWEFAVQGGEIPAVITLDHHMDTRSAFYRLACDLAGQEEWKRARRQLLLEAETDTEADIEAVLEKLRNNEHIDFAIEKDIISKAVVFSMVNAGIVRDYANDRIYYVDDDCSSNCRKDIHDEACLREVYDKVIESEELRFKLGQANRFLPEFFSDDCINERYILDIDLDCFHTKKSIAPEDVVLFNKLVQGAEIITIATEGSYVEMEKIEEDVNEYYLLERLMGLIEGALLEDNE